MNALCTTTPGLTSCMSAGIGSRCGTSVGFQVWCESQAAVIAARQQARVAEAKERVEREVIADDFGDQLRAALAASGEELPKSTVQFEELQD
mmetsp:Transcript_69243/g.186560  ORF Transcript_69243/g.186560 Transcript_69243/m.186560 type:complete len:92 (-) Transcript_69243:108-383(-)